MKTKDQFSYTSIGYRQAENYLRIIEKWDEVENNELSTHWVYIVFQANSIYKESQLSKTKKIENINHREYLAR